VYYANLAHRAIKTKDVMKSDVLILNNYTKVDMTLVNSWKKLPRRLLLFGNGLGFLFVPVYGSRSWIETN